MIKICKTWSLFFFLGLSFLAVKTHAQTFADTRVGGTVHLNEELFEDYNDQGVLFVTVRAHGVSSGPPLAAVRIERPKYPQAFAIGPKNATIPGRPFQGPFTLSARHSLSGDALDGQALSASLDPELKIQLGQRDIELFLNN